MKHKTRHAHPRHPHHPPAYRRNETSPLRCPAPSYICPFSPLTSPSLPHFPQKRDYKIDDLLLEQQLDEPILGIAAGRFSKCPPPSVPAFRPHSLPLTQQPRARSLTEARRTLPQSNGRDITGDTASPEARSGQYSGGQCEWTGDTPTPAYRLPPSPCR